jgi:hypothetical protein
MNDITPDPIDSVPSSLSKTIDIVISEPAPSVLDGGFTEGREWVYAPQPTPEEPYRVIRVRLLERPSVNMLDGEQVLTEVGVMDGEEFLPSQNDVPGLRHVYGNYEGPGSKLQLR